MAADILFYKQFEGNHIEFQQLFTDNHVMPNLEKMTTSL